MAKMINFSFTYQRSCELFKKETLNFNKTFIFQRIGFNRIIEYIFRTKGFNIRNLLLLKKNAIGRIYSKENNEFLYLT